VIGVIPQRGRLLMERTGCVLDVLLVLAGALRFGSMSMFLERGV
jgi:hypothetical protein